MAAFKCYQCEKAVGVKKAFLIHFEGYARWKFCNRMCAVDYFVQLEKTAREAQARTVEFAKALYGEFTK